MSAAACDGVRDQGRVLILATEPAYDKRWAYPGYDKPYFEVWAGRYESVFVWFHPFFRLDGVHSLRDGYFVSRLAKNDEAIAAYKREASNSGEIAGSEISGSVYSEGLLNSLCHPDEVGFSPDRVELIGWDEAAKLSELESQTEEAVYLGLMTSIAGLKTEYARLDSAEKLMTWCAESGVFPPREGEINPAMFPAMNALMHRVGTDHWIHQREFDFDPVRRADFRKREELEWGHRGGFYMIDPEVLVTVDWDSFFTLAAGPADLIKGWVEDCQLDGFFADRHTRHDWWLRTNNQIH